MTEKLKIYYNSNGCSNQVIIIPFHLQQVQVSLVFKLQKWSRKENVLKALQGRVTRTTRERNFAENSGCECFS